MDYSAYVPLAKALAHEAHAGQVDKAGEPYIHHVARVAAAVSDDPLAECVAWLYDVLEDCAGYAPQLYEFPDEIRWGVYALTRLRTETYAMYLGRVRRMPWTLRVKLADIADNSDPERLAKLDDKTAARLRRKYGKARKMLGAG